MNQPDPTPPPFNRDTPVAELLDEIEEIHELAATDPFGAAWRAVDIARYKVKRDDPKALAAHAFLWNLAQYCEERLNLGGRSTRADTGETAADQIRVKLSTLAGSLLFR
jgi:hypothetical protein